MTSHRRHHQRRAMGIERRQLLPVGSTTSTSTTGKSNNETSKPANTPTTSSTSTSTTSSPTTTTTQNTPRTTSTPPPTTTQNNTPTTTSTTANNPPTTATTPTTSPTTQATTARTTTSSSSSTTQQQQQTTQQQQQQTTPPAQTQNTTPAQRGPTTVFSTQSGAGLPSLSAVSPSSTSQHKDGDGADVGGILGTTAGVVGGIIVICVVAGFLMRRWRKKQDREEAEAAGSAFDAGEFRKSAMMLNDSASDRSPRPPSIIERRLNANPMSSYGMGMGYGAAGGYGHHGYGYGHGPAQGGYDRGSFYEDQYAQQYIPPQPGFSPMSSDPFVVPPISPSGTPAPGTPAPGFGAPSSMYDVDPHSPLVEPPIQRTLSPGLQVPGAQQQAQDVALNRLSTASSILVNPFDSVAFGSGPVDLKRQASFDSMPPTPTTPAQGLESFLKDPDAPSSTSQSRPSTSTAPVPSSPLAATADDKRGSMNDLVDSYGRH